MCPRGCPGGRLPNTWTAHSDGLNPAFHSCTRLSLVPAVVGQVVGLRMPTTMPLPMPPHQTAQNLVAWQSH